MKPSTLACYLEAIANVLRTTRGDSLPTINHQSTPRPMVIIGTNRLPIPDHSDAVDFLATCFPKVPSGVMSPVETSGELEALRAQVRRTLASHQETITQRDEARKELELLKRDARRLPVVEAEVIEARRELEALRRTVDRMRVAPSVTISPALKNIPVPTQAQLENLDHLSQILAEQETQIAPRPRPTFTIQPLMIGFPRNGQGKVLSASAYTLEALRERFTFRFTNPKDPTAGGYWLAKDSLAPAAQTIAEDLTRHGAFILSTVPTA